MKKIEYLKNLPNSVISLIKNEVYKLYSLKKNKYNASYILYYNNGKQYILTKEMDLINEIENFDKKLHKKKIIFIKCPRYVSCIIS